MNQTLSKNVEHIDLKNFEVCSILPLCLSLSYPLTIVRTIVFILSRLKFTEVIIVNMYT